MKRLQKNRWKSVLMNQHKLLKVLLAKLICPGGQSKEVTEEGGRRREEGGNRERGGSGAGESGSAGAGEGNDGGGYSIKI